MKLIGTTGADEKIMLVNRDEFHALRKLAGYEWPAADGFDVDLGPVLQKLAVTRLARIVELLRYTADQIERDEQHA